MFPGIAFFIFRHALCMCTVPPQRTRSPSLFSESFKGLLRVRRAKGRLQRPLAPSASPTKGVNAYKNRRLQKVSPDGNKLAPTPRPPSRAGASRPLTSGGQVSLRESFPQSFKLMPQVPAVKGSLSGCPLADAGPGPHP